VYSARVVARAGMISIVAAIAGVLTPVDARAVEVQVGARTIAEGYQERWIRPGQGDVLLNRRRFVQTLDLDAWGLLAAPVDPGHPERTPPPAADLYVTSALRIQHDFGDWVGGTVDYSVAGVPGREPAHEAVPELGADRLQLDVPFAYLGGRRVFGWLDFKLGRQLELDPLDWYALDGLMLRAHLPVAGLAIEVHGGGVGRDASLWASARHDPDGTSTTGCERIESIGAGWIPADGCAQRDVRMPGFGAALVVAPSSRLQMRVAYRRSMSDTASTFGPAASGWGVNQELVTGWMRLSLAGGLVAPHWGVRENLALGQIDEAHAGVRLGGATHALTPEVAYSRPSFDLDSIWNVFVTMPVTDFRATYEAWPWAGRWRAHVRGSLRRYDTTGEDAPGASWARAVAAGVRYGGGRGWLRVDGFAEGGEGGRLAGVDLSGRMPAGRTLLIEGRATAIGFDDPLARRRLATLGVQGGVRWLMAQGIAVQLVGEYNLNEDQADRVRVIGILDLAFRPEL
jgi:hypothetical protein